MKKLNKTISITPGEIPIPQLHAYLQSSVAPRPIAFVSTVDKDGRPNLSPFSFFNIFGSNPPLAIFSPARRVRGNTTKHTLQNVEEVKECVINIVNYSMVNQTSLASVEYPKGINEFEKAGFTAIASELVKPFRVAESPVQLECKVRDIIYTGTEGGAGNLILAEIVKIHIDTSILDESGKIDQHKIDLVARLGGDWYVRASGNALFEVEKPITTIGIGVDQIPEEIRNSDILTGNNLGQLGNVEHLPTPEEIEAFYALNKLKIDSNSHVFAKQLLSEGKVHDAWCALLSK